MFIADSSDRRSPVYCATAGLDATLVEPIGARDALVRISSLVGGEAVAARASVEGTVAEVCVAPGVAIKSGDVVVKINRN